MVKLEGADSQTKLFAAIIMQIRDDVARGIDWDKAAEDAGYKNANTARTQFSTFRKRLLTNNSKGDGTAGAVDKDSPTKKRVAKPKSAIDENGADAKTSKSPRKHKAKKSEATIKDEPDDDKEQDVSPAHSQNSDSDVVVKTESEDYGAENGGKDDDFAV